LHRVYAAAVLLVAHSFTACAADVRPRLLLVNDATIKFDNACADVAAVVVSRVYDTHYPEWVRLCNANHDKGICKETIKMITQVMKGDSMVKMPPGPLLACE
jgi:hypothetical protein